ncbi:MipA/OmpV family protein [Oryzomonas sagensis]|uniref:MipA/OmpV family protein n=1 Tax=Oryzomonas sagensis TaxID=2603857 RepID=A0ABQ6TMT1_9BACT|nr:MipA/OmpV family protein [Oryzomonas sagensis]KAB0669735.1 MipA/OmpV family protein [Oryzomonas sagensis]
MLLKIVQDGGMKLFIKAVIALALSCSIPAMALAEESGKEGKNDWDVSLGLGLAAAPAYEGSTHYLASPIPVVAITWRDTVSLGINGLSLYHKSGGVRYGVGLTYDPGRKENGKNLLGMSSGDHRLAGLGDIKPAAGLKAFASYDVHPFQHIPLIVLDASVIKLIGGSTNDGVLVQGDISMPFQLGQNWRLTPKVATTWANDHYMQDYFGVTPEQATRSQFSAYKAKAGMKDAGIGLNVTYSIDKNWFVSGDGRVKRLLSDAASSPIAATNINASIVALVGYHF